MSNEDIRGYTMMDRTKGIEICLCGMCPTFVECKEEIAFCLAATGRSRCIQVEDGCLCPGCPVTEKEGFQHVYYCTRGSESDQH